MKGKTASLRALVSTWVKCLGLVLGGALGDLLPKATWLFRAFGGPNCNQSNKLDLKISPEFDAEFSSEYFHSHTNKELVFLHKPTRTLIEADLLFNLPATEQFSKSGVDATSGILTKLFGGLMNTRGEMLWQKRFLWYAAGGKDRKGFTDSANRIKAWDYDRVIPCHGDVIETGGKTIIDRATAWFTEGK